MKRVFYLIFVLLLFPSVSFSQGLLGKPYLELGFQAIKPGDDLVKEIDDTITQFGLFLNCPINENIDFSIFFAHSELEGEKDIEEKSNVIGLGFLHHFSPGKQIDPYISFDIALIESKARIYETTISDDMTHFGTEGGIEIKLGPQVALTPSIEWGETNDEDYISFDIGLNAWFNQNVGITLGLGYTTEDGDVILGCGIVF